MTVETFQPDGLPKRIVNGHLLYSHVVVVQAEKLIFISGQLARNKDGQVVAPGDMRAQIRQVGENLKLGLAAAGVGLDALVKTTTFVTDIEEFFKHLDVRMQYFFASPTSTTIQISRLSHPDFMIEVEAMAVIPS